MEVIEEERTGDPHRASRLAMRMVEEIERAVHGKPEIVRKAVVCLFAEGHLLLEDVPGVGKTTLAHALARSVAAEFRRIQFTSDLLPADLTGFSIPQRTHAEAMPTFHFQPGPLFGNIVLADEVNRASPRTQSALLEAMSEKTVSIDGVSHALPCPFFVIATQNPLEHHGTHPLPESQLDRFLMRLSLGYPDREHEARVLAEDPSIHVLPRLEAVLDLAQLLSIQATVRKVKLEESLLAYLLDLIEATRIHDGLAVGASTRAALSLRRAAQAHALLEGRDYCIPEDIRDLAIDVLAHRVGVGTRGGRPSESDEARWIIGEIVDRLRVPL